MLRLPISVISKLGPIVLVVSLVFVGWERLGPRRPEIGPQRKQLADEVIPQVVEDIRQARGRIQEVTLLHLQNDPTHYVTGLLRHTIEQSGILRLRDLTLSEKAFEVLNLQPRTFGSAREAAARGRALGAPAVLFGTITRFESYPRGANLEMEIHLLDVSSHQVVFSREYSEDTGPVPPAAATLTPHDEGFSWLHRLLAWLVIVLLLPVFTIPFLRAMLRKESNVATAFALAVYTLADGLLICLIIGVDGGSTGSLLVLAAGVAAAFVYDVYVALFALKLEARS